jgi:hypothetical protein
MSSGVETRLVRFPVLQSGFYRAPWSFDDLLATLLPHCPENERTLAQKLANAILDETKVEALESEPLWKAVEPIPLDVPWPDPNAAKGSAGGSDQLDLYISRRRAVTRHSFFESISLLTIKISVRSWRSGHVPSA